MIIDKYDYNGHVVEIHEHPIYHDFEFVVKENGQVKYASGKFYTSVNDAHNEAQAKIKQQ